MRSRNTATRTDTPPGESSHVARRTLLTAAAGGAALLCGAGTASGLTRSALQVSGSTQAYPLARHPLTAAASTLAGTDAAAGRTLKAAPGLAVVSVDVSGGHMVGVTFPGGASTDTISVRVRTDRGAWTGWSELPLNDSEPDPDTAEGRRSVIASDPLWVGALGSAATVEVRLPQGDVAGAHLQVVDPGESSVLTVRPARATRTPAANTTTGAAATALVETTDLAATTKATAVTRSVIAQPTIRSRAEWGADESLRKGSPSYNDTIKAAVVHHTADGGTYSQSEVPSVIRGMYRYHTVSLGWSDLGYNFVVDRFGGIWEGRAGGILQPVIGAHAGGFNTDTFGVSMMGDFTSIAPSAACLESVCQVLAWKLSMYGLPANGTTTLTSAGGGTAKYAAGTSVNLRTINAHRDVGYTACPGNVGFTKMDSIRARVAQLLSSSPSSPIDAKYAALGGGRGSLGGPTTAELQVPAGTGSYRFFTGGAIYYSAATGAHTVRGALLTEWGRLGWESGLGFPTSDDSAALNGFFNHFQKGSIYWSAPTGAHDVRDDIRTKWAAMGWERGPAGYPVTGNSTAFGGWFNHFQNGSIYYSTTTGAHYTAGAIRDRWAALGWERGLGFPTTDDTMTPNGKGWYNHFQGGSIYWSASTGAHAVSNGFRDTWASLGWETSWLGFPTKDEYAVDGGLRMDFEGGKLTWNRSTGKVTATRN
ncbi:MAG: N-acetylmuramoyl-L-alanine amidase [Janthinobacterium lividum]